MEEVAGLAEHYFTYESRLASFQMVRMRASTANPKAKAQMLVWPHKTIAPAELAKAGFFFHPLAAHPDQVACFLCHKFLDGWEAGDNPAEEHLVHASDCGWARLVAVEADVQNLSESDPMSVEMLEARKMTFAGRWPHEGKKGWKCKVKQMVEAGWHYTPLAESADMAMCAYCQLGLDGWEAGDKPLNEHYNRSPECPFFTLAAQNQTTKKPARSKAAAPAKASPRMSVQSNSILADGPSVMDTTAAAEDSVLTEASINPGSRKTSRAKKAPAKGRKTRAKKEEPEEAVVDRDRTLSPPPPPPTKTTRRGRKRGSEEVESAVAVLEAPATKKRATKTRGNNVADSTILTQVDASAVEKPGRGRKAAKAKRIVSNASTASQASLHDIPGAFPRDNEDDAREEDAEMKDQVAEKTPRNKSAYAMFDATPVQFDEEALDEELRELQEMMRAESRASGAPQDDDTEVEDVVVYEDGVEDMVEDLGGNVDEGVDQGVEELVQEIMDEVADEVVDKEPQMEEEEVLRVPKGRKTASDARKASTGSMVLDESSRHDFAEQPPEDSIHVYHDEPPKEEEPPTEQPEQVDLNASFTSAASTDTVVKAARKRGRPSKKSKSDTSKAAQGQQVSPIEGPKASTVDEQPAEPLADMEIGTRQLEASRHASSRPQTPDLSDGRPDHESTPAMTSPRVPSVAPSSIPRHAPSTPEKTQTPPPPSARQPTPSPSHTPTYTPQPNAEHLRPPGPMPTTATKRVEMAPLPTSTPKGSPLKNGIIPAGRIRTDGTPWNEMDIDAVFAAFEDTEHDGNSDGASLWAGKELTSPEKEMTVEQWIMSNASAAEARMRDECEVMVSRFESEGSRAMKVLEGLVTDS